MTTPEPRVRVWYSVDEALFYWRCGHCRKASGRLFIHNATRDAHRHAATCPALRLAALVRELEGLRDRLSTTADVDWYNSDPAMLRAFNIGRSLARCDAADDLTAIIDCAAGGTG